MADYDVVLEHVHKTFPGGVQAVIERAMATRDRALDPRK